MATPKSLFISYAHIDNEVWSASQEGWITSFHRALEVLLAQKMGERPRIWRDQKLQGNDLFGDEIIDQFPDVAAIISILSPRYITSEWCIREMKTFLRVAEQTGGVRIGNKSRVFKVIKTPVSIEKHPDEIRDILGYEFFKTEGQTGRARELSQDGPPELMHLYLMRLQDLADDIVQLLAAINESQGEGAEGPLAETAKRSSGNGKTPEKTIFLADTSADLREERDAVKRDLLQHGHIVLPEKQTPIYYEDFVSEIQNDLSRADLSVHMVGRSYGAIPDGADASIVVLENEMASKRSPVNDFERLIWIPPGIDIEDERQRNFYKFLQTDHNVQIGADILESSLEDLKAIILEKLKPKPKAEPEPEGMSDEGGLTRIYLICDPEDLEAVEPIEDFLYNCSDDIDVILPVFDGDEAQIREDHHENLKLCDAVLIYFGMANELWLRAKLRELQKIMGYGRTRPIRAKAIYVGGPVNRRKDRLRSREALVIRGEKGFSEPLFDEFLGKLK